jgi:hypothetical protein
VYWQHVAPERGPAPDADTAPVATRVDRAVLPVALAVLAVSLAVRVAYRSYFYCGWEILGPAKGQFLLATRPFGDVVREIVWSTRHFQYWIPVSSVLYTLLPGGLGRVLPWEYWAHLLTFVTTGLAFVVLARALRLDRVTTGYLLLAVAGSPALLSHAVEGYPYANGFLPHGLALWITQSERCRRRWLLSVVLGLLVLELSWHLYEMGRTNAAVFLAGAAFISAAPLATRLAWAALGGLQTWMVFSIEAHTTAGGVVFGVLSNTAALVGQAGYAVVDAMFLGGAMDVPILFLLGLVGLAFIRREATFFRCIYLAQFLPLVLLAMISVGELRTRRFLLLDWYGLMVLGLWLHDLRSSERAVRQTILGFLALGVVLQLVNLWSFTRPGIEAGDRSLPYTVSLADFAIRPPLIRTAHQLAGAVEGGARLVLVYDFHAYPENTTDPQALLERLYLRLGHERFVERIHVFSDLPCRYSCLPIAPLADLPAFVASLGALDPAELERTRVVRYTDLPTQTEFAKDASTVVGALEQRFELVPRTDLALAPGFAVDGLRPRAAPPPGTP